MTELLDRFIRYVKINTTSRENAKEIPSTKRQFDLANILTEELKQLGIKDAKVDEHCIVTATLPSNLPANAKTRTLMFNAHLDTSPEEPGENVKPTLVRNYRGGEIRLPGDEDLTISPDDRPILKEYVGHDIVTSDGTTLLGADDKAGIAVIMTAVSTLTRDPSRKHGAVKIVFTPDEEVGTGIEALDIEALKSDYGFTVDNDGLYLGVETFNAARGTIRIEGFNIHPGEAYGKMINSIRVLPDAIELFPPTIAPETTKEHQGYYHPYHVEASVNEAKLVFILRDFDYNELKKKMATIEEGVKSIQQKYPKARVSLKLEDQYRNMKEILDKVPELIETAEEAIRKAGLKVRIKPIRGGTDGARMSFKGLPTPNLFCGYVNEHSKKEFVSVQVMEKAVATVLNIVDIFVQKRQGQ
ncbi:MAG: peptidase T [Promethearchaeati archaeon SRVP18_Atabeyarchaeia-1]